MFHFVYWLTLSYRNIRGKIQTIDLIEFDDQLINFSFTDRCWSIDQFFLVIEIKINRSLNGDRTATLDFPHSFCLFQSVIAFHGLQACKQLMFCSFFAFMIIIYLIVYCVTRPYITFAFLQALSSSSYSFSHPGCKLLLAIQSSEPHCRISSSISSRTLSALLILK